MLVDEVDITAKAGHGGAGRASFYPRMGAGPDGGNGGKGGDIYIVGTTDITALAKFAGKGLWTAENGQGGEDFTKSGKTGQDLILEIPVGTSLIDQESGSSLEVVAKGEKILIASGGLGGKGNYALRSSRNTTPKNAQPGLPGQERKLKLVLKLIADFGLIGLPNAGKSSLLNELTEAQVKVGTYPFTTLEANLGVYQKLVLADIPGLIEGASTGKGLGVKFLKHIEKVKTLLHLISAESADVKKDYLVIRHELEKYNPTLIQKPEMILLTKSDLADKKTLEKQIKALQKLNPQTYSVSIHDWESLETLKKLLNN